jgi:hypothetical protein
MRSPGHKITMSLYEESVRRLTDGRRAAWSRPPRPVEGLMMHIAGQGDSGFQVVDVWESEALDRFGEILLPMLEKLGVHEPAHTLVSG